MRRPTASPLRAVLITGFLLLALPIPGAAREQETKSGALSTGTTTGTTLLAPSRTLLSGTLLKRSAATTTWFLYPGACADRAANTWSPRTSPVADSLNSYAASTTGPYTAQDQSLKEILWHKVTTSVPSGERPAAGAGGPIFGTAAIWAGKYDPNWVVKVGYPNVTYQLLYIDTGAHAGNYTMTFHQYQSCEQNYDFVYLIGGGNSDVDPIGNSRAKLDNLVANGFDGNSRLLVTWTGSISPSTPGALSINGVAGGVTVTGPGSGQPGVTAVSVSMAQADRAVYLLFTSEERMSSEDGLWPYGNGIVLDDLTTSDNGPIFTDGSPVLTPDNVTPASAGQTIQGSFGSAGYISGRVVPGAGALWHLAIGSTKPTADFCSPDKALGSNLFFEASDAGTGMTAPGSFASIVTCTFPIPAGTASVTASWREYRDLQRGSGLVAVTEYRVFGAGGWSNWMNAQADLSLRVGGEKAWSAVSAELASAVQADSVQLRFTMQCVPLLSSGPTDCSSVQYGLFYDDLGLKVMTGVPIPTFGLYPGTLPQSTFVDGTMTGVNCATPPCWPGIRGSDVPSSPGNSNVAIHDNFNGPLGDSITVSLVTGLRKNGMGINWKQGFDRTVSEGLTIARTNGAYNAAFDQPRVIYRLFDPTSKSWSPWDSSALDANSVSIAAGPPADTVVIDGEYRMDWPPRDKVGLDLPGGFTINGVGAYSSLDFLPRGSRLQYYFKAVDINGGVVYQFGSEDAANEVQDLPLLPGGAVRAPDILEFRVLPGAYAPGAGGTLLAGRTDTPVLNLDGAYTTWSFGLDPVTQALRGMGVRADRYRFLQGLDQGSNIGGHELTGAPDVQRPARDSNYFPNMTEYSVRESLSTWYRILIQSSHLRTATLDDEADARLIEEWWSSATPGTNGGDRCFFVSGDDYFNALLNTSGADPSPRRHSMGNNVLGVNAAAGSWNGTTANLFPTVEDRFANPASGPGLVAGYSYPVDGGCPGANRFDALTRMAGTDAQNAALYPLFAGVNDVAAVATMSEKDAVTDNDRNKALGYGYSIQFVRKAGIPTGAASYPHSGVQERMQILYKFLASCRGAREGAADTAKCWPCPTDPNMTGNWATLSGFQTGSYGPLYPIQDNLTATGIEELPAAESVPRVNALGQNRPNPFNPETVIPFSLAARGRVVIRIFDIGGRLVRTLIDRREEAGPHEVRWNGATDHEGRVASGVYFYRITYPDGSISARKMMILR